MADRKVSFDVVVGGIQEVKKSFKSVQDYSKQSAQNYLRDEAAKTRATQQATKKIERDYERMFKSIERAEQKAATEHEREENKKLKATEKAEQSALKAKEKSINQQIRNDQRQTASYEREQEKRLKTLQRNLDKEAQAEKRSKGQGFNLIAMGHLAQAAGFNGTGHILRSAGTLGIGSSVEGAGAAAGEGALASAGGLGAVASVALPVAAALGAVMIAAKLVETGFSVLSTEAQHVASAFLGAITQIGGAKNLQEMLVSSAQQQSQTGAVRMTVAADERLSTDELEALTSKLSEDESLGGFDKKAWSASIADYGSLTGKQRSIDPGAYSFAAKFALMSKDANGNANIGDSMKMMSFIQAQNKDMSQAEVQQIMLAGAGIGQHGAFSTAQVVKSPDILEQVSKFGGDRAAGYKTVFGLASILSSQKGGNIDSANTQISGILKGLDMSHVRGKDFGSFINGQMVDPRESIARALSKNPDDLPTALIGRLESKTGLDNLRNAAGITGNETEEQKYQMALRLLDAESKYALTVDDLNSSAKENIGENERIHTAFNKLNNQLEAALLPLLEQVVPKVKEFTDGIVANKASLVDAIKHIVLGIELAVPAMFELAKMTLLLTGYIAMMTKVTGYAIDKTEIGWFSSIGKDMQNSAKEFETSQSSLLHALSGIEESIKNASHNIAEIGTKPAAAEEQPGTGYATSRTPVQVVITGVHPAAARHFSRGAAARRDAEE